MLSDEEKIMDIIKGKLLMIKRMLEEDDNDGHTSAYEMQSEDFEAIQGLLDLYNKEKEKNKELEDTLKQTQNSWYKDTKVIEKQSKEIEELNRLKGFEMLDIFNMGKQSSRQRIEFDYVDKDKIKAKIQECREILYSFEKELELKANKDKFIHKESMNCLLGQISILQSLLEKE